jgi:nitrite reductase/ring-hydroxylating ferredoxin subunit
MSKTEVAKSDQVKEGAVHVVSAGGKSIALTRVKGSVQAFENKCPHLGLALSRGKIEGSAITCPWHGSKYDMCSGKNLDWVNSFVGIPMPEWTHGMIAMGKKPAGITTFNAEEKNGAVSIEV